MKKLLFILAVAMLLSATNSFASPPYRSWLQEPGDTIKLFSNDEFFSKADYIIEAKYANGGGGMYDAGGNYNPDEFYTSFLLVVTRVYKNNSGISIAPGDTLHYIRKGAVIIKPLEEYPFEKVLITPNTVDYDTRERESAFGMEDEYQSIYFLKKSDFPENPDARLRSRHPKVSMLQDIKRASIKIGGRALFNGPIWGLNDLHFDNRYELYKYMEQFEGVNVPISDIEHIRWHLGTNSKEFEQYLKERNINWQEYQESGRQHADSLMRSRRMEYQKRQQEKKKSEQGPLKSPQLLETLYITIKNQAVKYDPTKQKYYFHFDVYAGAGGFSTFFDYITLILNYNTTAFGTNIAGNNKLEVNNGATFNTNTYTTKNLVCDFSSNQLQLGIGPTYVGTPARTRLTTIPVELLKVKIELPNGLIGVSSGIYFGYAAGITDASCFTTASNSAWNNYFYYDFTDYSNPSAFSIYTVPPTLHALTPIA